MGESTTEYVIDLRSETVGVGRRTPLMNRFFVTVLEVYQFARDAAVAEAWLMAQEPYLMSTEFGVSIMFSGSDLPPAV